MRSSGFALRPPAAAAAAATACRSSAVVHLLPWLLKRCPLHHPDPAAVPLLDQHCMNRVATGAAVGGALGASIGAPGTAQQQMCRVPRADRFLLRCCRASGNLLCSMLTHCARRSVQPASRCSLGQRRTVQRGHHVLLSLPHPSTHTHTHAFPFAAFPQKPPRPPPPAPLPRCRGAVRHVRAPPPSSRLLLLLLCLALCF